MGKGKPSLTSRVVALVSSEMETPPLPEQAGWVCVASPYEAAAELLSAPASALVVDLERITSPHVRLLELATRMGVPVFAYGTVRATISPAALKGLRLVGRGELDQALADVLGTPQAGRPETAVGPEPAGGTDGEFVPAAESAPPKPAAAAPKPAPPASAQVRTPRPVGPNRPSEALTEEELRALLGNGS